MEKANSVDSQRVFKNLMKEKASFFFNLKIRFVIASRWLRLWWKIFFVHNWLKSMYYELSKLTKDRFVLHVNCDGLFSAYLGYSGARKVLAVSGFLREDDLVEVDTKQGVVRKCSLRVRELQRDFNMVNNIYFYALDLKNLENNYEAIVCHGFDSLTSDEQLALFEFAKTHLVNAKREGMFVAHNEHGSYSEDKTRYKDGFLALYSVAKLHLEEEFDSKQYVIQSFPFVDIDETGSTIYLYVVRAKVKDAK